MGRARERITLFSKISCMYVQMNSLNPGVLKLHPLKSMNEHFLGAKEKKIT
jgi:hypothetical protein